MKPQDIIFLFFFIFVIVKKIPKFAAIAGIACLVIAMPLFAKWIFFTAERLVAYAAAFFFLSVVLYMYENRH